MHKLYELAEQIGMTKKTKFNTCLNYMLEEAPILASIPFKEACITADEHLEELNLALLKSSNGNINSMDYGFCKAIIEGQEDTANMFGGFEKYFSRKAPYAMRRAGMHADKHIFENIFLPWALSTQNVIDAQCKGDNIVSLLAVRFSEEGTCGLYHPQCVTYGNIFDTYYRNDGYTYKAKTGPYTGDGMTCLYVNERILKRLQPYSHVQLKNTHIEKQATWSGVQIVPYYF